MKKLAHINAVILGIQNTQYKITDNIKRHFDAALVCAVKEKDHNDKIANVVGAHETFNAQRISPVRGFAEALSISENSLQKSIHRNLHSKIYGHAIQHIKHDSKLCAATDRLKRHVEFATITHLSSDFAQDFYRVSGLRNVHSRESIFAHEDVDFAGKTTVDAYWPVFSYLGYQQGDDLSGVLVVDANREALACAKGMGMITTCIGDKNLSPLQEGPIDFEYQNIKVLMNELYNAKREATPIQERKWHDLAYARSRTI
jgi:hypothetical protein